MPRRRALLLTALMVTSALSVAAIAFRAWADKPLDVMSRAKLLRAEQLDAPFESLKSVAEPITAPQSGDWLAEHPEGGQSVASYKASKPVRPDEKRRTVVLQPIGKLSPEEAELVKATGDFITRFYGLPVTIESSLEVTVIPKSARRNNPHTGEPQVLTAYVLDSVLKPRVSKDVLAVIGLTGEDLYPDPSWNFVFGQASLEDRVGVWSFHRFGDLKTEKTKVLDRTLKTAVHEFGHMLGMHHCVAFECVMNGSNHLGESDARPVEPCPACLAKLSWNTGIDPAERYKKVIEFYEANGLERAAIDAKKRAAAVRK